MSKVTPLKLENDILYLLDQRKLPHEEIYIECHSTEDIFNAIRDMVVRGAPLIGYSGIYALAFWFKNNTFEKEKLSEIVRYISTARPTAVNLAFELERSVSLLSHCNSSHDAYKVLLKFVKEEMQLSESRHLKLAHFVKDDLLKRKPQEKYRILTHCNTGYLACGTIGTALGAIEVLFNEGLLDSVWVDETRPYLQGSRLTAFELSTLSIPHKIVVEGAASYLMSKGLVDAIFVGADRIALNGDTANKVGTNNLAILAKNFKIPFYVLAPKSSFDTSIESGDEILIENRPQDEILNYKDLRIAPLSSQAFNPSFDITKSEFITGIACEDLIITSHFKENIKKAFL